MDLMVEKDTPIIQSIIYEIEFFKHNRNGFPPEKIFVSYPLYYKIMGSFGFYSNKDEKETLCGIPVQPYKSDEYEFYLAEKKGKFRRTIDDEKQIVRKVDETE